jgi:hypothetical protein
MRRASFDTAGRVMVLVVGASLLLAPTSLAKDSLAKQSDRDALSTAKKTSPQAFANRPTTPLAVPHGKRLGQYLGPHSAQLVDENGDKPSGLVISTTPLLAGPRGAQQPTDFSLVERDGRFIAANPVVPIALPYRLADGMTIGDDVAMRVKGVVTGATALRDGQHVFYANAFGTDVGAPPIDIFATPVDMGVEIFAQLREARRQEIELTFALPPGSLLDAQKLPNGEPSGWVEIQRGKKTLAMVSPVLAFDADEQPVPAHYEISGRGLTIVVEPGPSAKAPILVDPQVTDYQFVNFDAGNTNGTITDGFGWYRASFGVPLSYWSFVPNADNSATGGACPRASAPAVNPALCVGAFFGANYGGLSSGEWIFKPPAGAQVPPTNPDGTPNDSYVYRLDMRSAYYQLANTQIYAGLYQPRLDRWIGVNHRAQDQTDNKTNPFLFATSNNSFYRTYCFDTSCTQVQTSPDIDGVYARWGILASGSSAGGVATMQGAAVFQYDRSDPSITVGHDFDPNGWYRTRTLVTSIAGRDKGLGMKELGLVIPQVGSTISNPRSTLGCDGTRANRCPLNHSSGFTYATTSMPEGVNTVSALSRDILSKTSGATFTVKVDRTPPPAPDVVFETPDDNTAAVSWDEVVDPPLPDGTRSGVVEYRVRYRINGGAFGAWASLAGTARESAETPAYSLGTTIEFEVVAVDAAGNTSAAAASSSSVEGDGPELLTSGPMVDVDGGYVAAAPTTLTAEAVDIASGVQRFLLRTATGALVAQHEVSCPGGTCPTTASGGLQLDLTNYPEGLVELAASSVDKLLNPSSPQDITFVVDKTAPAAPTNIRQIAATLTTATIAWSEAGDPGIAPDLPGSGPREVRFRVRRLLGTFGPWQTSITGTAEIPAILTEILVVEAQSVDEVGNVSPITSTTVTVLPDILLDDLDLSGQLAADHEASQASPPLFELASPDQYAYEGDFDGSAETRAETTTEESQLEPGTDTRQPCGLWFTSAFNDNLPSRIRQFTPTRTVVEARLFVQCVSAAPLPSYTNSIQLGLTLAYHIGDGRYRALGSLAKRSYDNPRKNYQLHLAPIRRMCDAPAGGRKQYLVVGHIKYKRGQFVDSDTADLSYRIAVRQSSAREILCPTAESRRHRETAAFSRLARYNPNDPNDTTIRQPSAWLRGELGSEPPKPSMPAGSKPITRAWAAHHTDAPARETRPWRSAAVCTQTSPSTAYTFVVLVCERR